LAKLSDSVASLPIALLVGKILDKPPLSVASAHGKWRLQPEFKSEYSIGRKCDIPASVRPAPAAVGRQDRNG
jgi:hypothetical protein